mgnify:CR=1 FL=1
MKDQLDLFAEQRNEWFESDRIKAQEKIDKELEPYLGPLIVSYRDLSGGMLVGDAIRYVKCPNCGMIDWCLYRLLILNGCRCNRYYSSHVRPGPGLMGWKIEDGKHIYCPVWTEEDGWLKLKEQPKPNGRRWEFQAYWNDCLKYFQPIKMLVEVTNG